jgi:hypothetical protein
VAVELRARLARVAWVPKEGGRRAVRQEPMAQASAAVRVVGRDQARALRVKAGRGRRLRSRIQEEVLEIAMRGGANVEKVVAETGRHLQQRRRRPLGLVELVVRHRALVELVETLHAAPAALVRRELLVRSIFVRVRVGDVGAVGVRWRRRVEHGRQGHWLLGHGASRGSSQVPTLKQRRPRPRRRQPGTALLTHLGSSFRGRLDWGAREDSEPEGRW